MGNLAPGLSSPRRESFHDSASGRRRSPGRCSCIFSRPFPRQPDNRRFKAVNSRQCKSESKSWRGDDDTINSESGRRSDHEGKRLSRVGKQQMSVSVPRIVPSTTLPSFLTLLLSIPTQGTARAHSWHLLMLLLFGCNRCFCSPSSPLSHLHLHLHWQLHSHLHFAFNFALCRSCGGTCARRWLLLLPLLSWACSGHVPSV